MELPNAGQTVFLAGSHRQILDRGPVVRTESGSHIVCHVRTEAKSGTVKRKLKIHDDGTFEVDEVTGSPIPRNLSRWHWHQEDCQRAVDAERSRLAKSASEKGYKVYPKDSPEAESFRAAFAQARADGKGTFVWENRKYLTVTADELGYKL